MAAWSRNPPDEMHWLAWGDLGFDPELADGHDVRDDLKVGTDGPSRVNSAAKVIERIGPVPDSWVPGGTPQESANGRVGFHSVACDIWEEVEKAWRVALHWRRDLSDALAAMFAVILSTKQKGDSQLFLQVIGAAGSAKTKLCDALLVSKKCYLLEHLTGFHSGWKDGSGEDFSLLARVNGLTMITPEGDVIMSSPHFAEIMSQQRRIFDGTSSATYKNRKETMLYEGLRTPWIIAGTPALLDANQSRLGDRFLRLIIGNPDDDTMRNICRASAYSAMESVLEEANCQPESILNPRLLRAYQVTGGYADHLRDNPTALLARVKWDWEELFEYCYPLGEFIACHRARPDNDQRKHERHETKEMPTRTTHQLVRMALCLSVVLQHYEISDEVRRIIKKVALDTSSGKTMDICRQLYYRGPEHPEGEGMGPAAVAMVTHETEDRAQAYLRFMDKIGVANYYKYNRGKMSHGRYRLSPKLRELWTEVIGDA
jgi:hypothetical protein